MKPTSPPPPPPPRLRQLAAELGELQPMRRGSVSERTMKCNKPGCRCGEDPKARHGPYFSLTRGVEGQTRSRYLSEEQAALAREQIDAGQRFRRKVEAFWQGCEEWADQELEGSLSATVSLAKAEKKGSPRPSKAKSGKRSRPS
jgi:hypothetical protein